MKTVAIIGAGISGLSIAQLLKKHYQVRVYEKESTPGGLVRCARVNGHLYHKVGGHVFNSHRQDVLDWFWRFFDKELEFTKAHRNAGINMPDGLMLGYPIENHIYMMSEVQIKKIIEDLLLIAKNRQSSSPDNFEDFLKGRFGETLYANYFQPYNEKIWQKNLKEVPLSWLAGKLPMPTPSEIIYNNFTHAKEEKMVHSSFYYPQRDGSQFLANRFADSLNVSYNANITSIEKKGTRWSINGEEFDKVIFCGNIKDVPNIVTGLDIAAFNSHIQSLEYHGTTTVLCEIDKNQHSWIYLPDRKYMAHRIICTGNFASSNNANAKLSATIEFTDCLSKEEIEHQLKNIPLSPNYISHTFTPYTYPIQGGDTRRVLGELKQVVEAQDFYLLGRFAEWEYYNMDAAIGAAIDLSKRLLN